MTADQHEFFFTFLLFTIPSNHNLLFWGKMAYDDDDDDDQYRQYEDEMYKDASDEG